jgi:aryl-alcohol dehydrogenase-like predicted oxidoreductase
LKGRRDKVVIATKFGNTFDETTKQTGAGNASPAYIRQACEASLRRLDTDYLDLYQFHINGYPAEDAAPVRDTLEELVKEGKIRYYGWSTDFPERAAVFAEGKHCAAIQHDLNVIADNAPLLTFIENHGLASINRGPLGMGLLSGKYDANTLLAADDIRGKSPDWMQYFHDGVPNPDWLAKLAAIRDILTSGGRTLAQGALAWIWGRSPVTLPIPGFRTVKQITENARAMEFGPLTGAQVQEIDVILGR